MCNGDCQTDPGTTSTAWSGQETRAAADRWWINAVEDMYRAIHRRNWKGRIARSSLRAESAANAFPECSAQIGKCLGMARAPARYASPWSYRCRRCRWTARPPRARSSMGRSCDPRPSATCRMDVRGALHANKSEKKRIGLDVQGGFASISGPGVSERPTPNFQKEFHETLTKGNLSRGQDWSGRKCA